MTTKLMVALDVPRGGDAIRLVERIDGRVGCYKVGLELVAGGRNAYVVDWLSERGYRVMLDLKLHDTPRTVGAAVASVAARWADMWITVHAAGGVAMMEAAVEAADAHHIVAVSRLTSLGGVPDYVLADAERALGAGCVGLVTPGYALARVAAVYPELETFVPGIRARGEAKADQWSTISYRDAVREGANYAIVGRRIAGALDPRAEVALL